MTQAQTEHHDDDDDDDTTMVSVNIIDVRMECLRLATSLEMPASDVLVFASISVEFVLDGTTPAKRN